MNVLMRLFVYFTKVLISLQPSVAIVYSRQAIKYGYLDTDSRFVSAGLVTVSGLALN